MKWLCERMSPPEIWVWVWLSDLYVHEGSEVIRLTGERCPGHYSRKQLTRIILSLQQKKFLVIDQVPSNQYQALVVTIKKVFCIDKYVPAEREPGHGGPGGVVFDPEKKFARPSVSRQRPRGNGDGSKSAEVCPDMGVQAGAQLSLSLKIKDLKALAGMGQAELMREIMAMNGAQLLEVGNDVFKNAPRAKARKPSEYAKVYAGIRFMQGGHQQVRKNDQAWIEAVARRAHEDMERLWSEGRSGSAGKSLSPGKFAIG